jgi:DNA topoisomerase-1
MAVTDYLVDNFPKIMDMKFTAHLEDELDDIVTGKEELNRVLDEFYYPFQESLKTAEKQTGRVEIQSDEKCPECGAPMVIKFGRTGRFLGCSKYPDCKTTKPIDGEARTPAQETEFKCPKCGKNLRRKEGKRGPFLYCSGYPTCKEIFEVGENGQPVPREEPKTTEHACPKCGKPMIRREGSRGPFLGCSAYPKCRGTMPVDEKGEPIKTPEIDVKCEKCGGPMGVKRGRRGAFLGCLAYPKCRSTQPIPEDLKEKFKALDTPASSGPDLKTIEVEETCENCGGAMVVRRGRGGFFLGCASYPKCKGTREPGEATMEKITALTGV